MGFLRRLYYTVIDGHVILSYSIQESFVVHGFDWDFENQQELIPYADRRDETGVFEWMELDPELEEEFATSYGVSVDVSVTPHTLVFDHTPPEPPPTPPTPDEIYQAGADAALKLISGGE